MHTKLYEHVQRLLLDRDKYSLEHQILNILTIVAAIMCFIIAFSNYYLNLGWMIIVTSLACGITMVLCGYISIKFRNYNLAVHLVIGMMVFVFLPGMFFLNGGVLGSIPYFMVMFSAVIAVLLKGRGKVILLIIYTGIICSLIYLGYKFPTWVVGYRNNIEQYTDICLSILLSALFNTLLFNVVARSYTHEHKKFEEVNQLLNEEKRKLERLSVIDELTNIYNYRYIITYLEDKISDCRSNGQLLTVIFLDIDDFKLVNDTYGHLFGDYVLKRISKTISSNLWENNLVGRYGGEEFLIILPGVGLEQGYKIAEKIRQEINSLQWHDNLQITVSGGAVKLGDERVYELLDRVDKLMYKAKKMGKNRIEKAA